MAKKHLPYTPEFRRQMIELGRAGRMPEELAKEFEPSAQAIRNWVAQADRDEGRREDRLTTAERASSTRRGVRTASSSWSANPLKSRGLVRRETDVIPPRGSNS